MTKKEKKEVLKNLIIEIEQTADIDDQAAKRSQLFKEVLNAGYREGTLQTVTKAVNMWCKDFDMNMEAKLKKSAPANSRQFISMSALGLLTLIDTSLLPD